MELLQGCQNKADQKRVEQFYLPFMLYWPAEPDCQGALQDYTGYHLSNNLGLLDALIGHTAAGLNAELATFNVKHYGVITGLKTIQPY